MGTFTDQVQGLASEQKLARLEREQSKEDKKRREKQEISLFFTLDNILNNSSENLKTNTLKELYAAKNRDLIIDKIAENGDIKDIYVLTKKYNNILNKVYQGYKLNDKELIQEQKEAEREEKISCFSPPFTIEEYLEHTQKTNKKDKIKILYIILLPLLCIIWFLQGLTKKKRRK